MDLKPATQLYQLLTSQDLDVEILDTKTGQPPIDTDTGESDISNGNLFVFDWEASSGKNYGTAQILLDNDRNLILAYGDNLGRGMESEDKDEWYNFMLQLKNFAARNRLTFTPQNFSKLKHSLATMSSVKESILESYYGNRKISYSGNPTEARLMIKHNRDIAEGDARFRNIESLFIETNDGERFKLPFRNLAGGRAMLEHVRNGGRPYDIRGTHIVEMIQELAVLSRFRKAHHGRMFEGVAGDLVQRSDQYFESLRHNIKSLSTSRGYNNYFESWKPLEITQEDTLVEELKGLFVEQKLDDRIEQALPLLARLKQDPMRELKEFADHLDNMTRGTWATPDTPEAQKKLLTILTLDSVPVGADAEDLTVQLNDLLGDDELFDQLKNLAADDAGADAKPIIMARMEELRDLPGVADTLDQLQSGTPDQEQPELGNEEFNEPEPTDEADNLATFEGNPNETGVTLMRETDLVRIKSLLGKI